MYTSNHYDLQLLIAGQPIRDFTYAGTRCLVVALGQTFTLRVTNRSYSRVEALIAVDGLSVMDGEVAKFDDTGYVVDARSSITIPGWRLNHEEVANFKFGGKSKSYAQKSGKPLNIGVIGCAVFEEQASSVWTLTIGPPVVICNSRGVLRGITFFITHVATPHLDGRHAVFGRVVEGPDVVMAIPERDPMTAREPGLAMTSVTVAEEEWAL